MAFGVNTATAEECGRCRAIPLTCILDLFVRSKKAAVFLERDFHARWVVEDARALVDCLFGGIEASKRLGPHR